MDLREWEERFNAILEEEVDHLLKENKSRLISESPFKSEEQQISQSKNELMNFLGLEGSSDQIEKALSLILNLLPQQITPEQWNEVHNELITSDEKLLHHLEAIEKGEIDPEAYFSIADMCGLSVETLKHCYELAQHLYNHKEYADALSLFGFLAALSPTIPEFWISFGMSAYQLGDYHKALEIYQLGQKLFPENIAFYMHAANTCIANKDQMEANIYLEQAKELFDLHPEKYKNEWSETYEFLNHQAQVLKKQ